MFARMSTKACVQFLDGIYLESEASESASIGWVVRLTMG